MYHILNWNTGLTEDDQFLEEILQYIKGFLDQDNSIAVLQQIPYKDYENKWNLHAIYMRILEVFPEIEYSIIKNDNFNNGYIIMMTVIITKLKTWDYCDDVVYPHAIASNREVAIKLHDKYSLLGLHAKNGQENLSYIKSISNYADIIVAEELFNAVNILCIFVVKARGSSTFTIVTIRINGIVSAKYDLPSIKLTNILIINKLPAATAIIKTTNK